MEGCQCKESFHEVWVLEGFLDKVILEQFDQLWNKTVGSFQAPVMKQSKLTNSIRTSGYSVGFVMDCSVDCRRVVPSPYG